MSKAAFYSGNKTFTLGTSSQEPLQPGEVRLKVAYCGVCGTDVHIYHGNMDKRVSFPQVIGHEVSGEIAELGPQVSGLAVGERVAVRPLNPGLQVAADNGFRHIGQNLKFIGIDSPGGMQTYWTVPAHTLHKLPEHLSLQHGALIEPLAVACHDLRLARLQPGENAVVIGGGPIGMLIGLVAKHKGARVLVAEINENRLQLARELGLETVNPNSEDVVARVEAFTDQAMADVVFEVSGATAGVKLMTQLPRVRGRIVLVAIHPEPRPVDLFRFFWRELQLIGARVYEPEDFEEAIQLAAAGSLPLEALITKVSPLEHVQQVFETIDHNPEGMKYLLQCS
jgi:(R,R)-butanediol dehydrogenase / meso-butanediol dehydrogenase / diacetyl reductase